MDDDWTADVAPRREYETLEDFCAWLAPRYRRSLGGARAWCERWREHPEAVERLTALWHAHEVLYGDGRLGPSTFWRDHLDPCMSALTDADGPFRACAHNEHSDRLAPLPGLTE